ncbi:MAG TPA: tetratricopeptide repeat protein, partial [Pyrinomonadaceae bacterium]
ISLPFYKKAAEINPQSVAALVRLGNNYFQLKDYRVAAPIYQKVLRLDAKNVDALYGLGICYVVLKNKLAARRQYEKIKPLNEILAAELLKEINGK